MQSLPLLTSHQLAQWLMKHPDLPIALRAPGWSMGLPAVVTHVLRGAVATQDSLAERLEIIVIEADPDHQMQPIPREKK